MRVLRVFVVAFLVLGIVGVANGWQQGPGVANGSGPPPQYARDGQYHSPGARQPHPYVYPTQPVPQAPPAYSPNRGAVPMQQAPGYSGYTQVPEPSYPYPPHHNPYYQGVSPKDLLANTIEWVLSLPATVMGRVSNFMDDNFFPRVPATSGASTEPPPQSNYQQPSPDSTVRSIPNAGGHPGGN